jgi:hypothetical protein
VEVQNDSLGFAGGGDALSDLVGSGAVESAVSPRTNSGLLDHIEISGGPIFRGSEPAR